MLWSATNNYGCSAISNKIFIIINCMIICILDLWVKHLVCGLCNVSYQEKKMKRRTGLLACLVIRQTLSFRSISCECFWNTLMTENEVLFEKHLYSPWPLQSHQLLHQHCIVLFLSPSNPHREQDLTTHYRNRKHHIISNSNHEPPFHDTQSPKM